jgi:hypothetical protein
MKSLSAFALLFVVGSFLAANACSDASDGSDTSGQDLTSTGCTVVSVKDGHTLSPAELAALNDPVANGILRGDNCPLTFTDIQAKLAKTDPCGPKEDGISTRFVTDRAQLLEKPDSYRAVVKRECNGRTTDHELFMSVFGISTQSDATGKVTASRVPQTTLELIGEQRVTGDGGRTVSGVFNFYAREDNQWKFFGSSKDFLSQSYDCNSDGACIPRAATAQRCASCHVGGGLVMKELESPWVNWEGDRQTPGTKDLIAANPQLFGKLGNGVDLESSVEDANQNDWVPTRVQFLKTLGLKEVLRPVFCSTDMNLKSDRQAPSVDLMTDRIFNGASLGNIKSADYVSAITLAGQRIVDGRTGKQLIGGKDNKPVADTAFGFTFPMRSRQDSDYATELQNQQIADIDLLKDILIIDFTRPLYSPTRCGLLDRVPDLAPEDMHFDKVKKALAGAFDGAQDAAGAELATHLKDETDAAVHDFAVKKFLDVCVARSKGDTANYLKELLRYASHLRKAAKRAQNATNGGIIEFSETLPQDNLDEPTTGFDPVTCKLP